MLKFSTNIYRNKSIDKVLVLILLVGFVYIVALRPQIYLERKLQKIELGKIIDGDTIELKDGSQVRYIGIDTPEFDEKYFTEATQRNKELLNNKDIYLEFGKLRKDKYDRTLGYIWIDNLLINEVLLKEGLAFPLFIPPNDKYQNKFIKAFKYAQKLQLNLWNSNLDNRTITYRNYYF